MKTPVRKKRRMYLLVFAHAATNSKYAGTPPLGLANNGSTDNPLINSPCDGNYMGNLPISYFSIIVVTQILRWLKLLCTKQLFTMLDLNRVYSYAFQPEFIDKHEKCCKLIW